MLAASPAEDGIVSRVPNSPIGLALIIALAIAAVALNCWANRDECEQLIAKARTSHDSIVVLSSRPVHNGLSCNQVLDR
jgi:hypothetical protein